MENIINGKYSDFEFSQFLCGQEWAKDWTSYFDKKYPLMTQMLEVENSTKVLIKFDLGIDHPAATSNFTIKINPKLCDQNDKGILIHEGVHVLQQYPNYVKDPCLRWAVEGIADYVRYKLDENFDINCNTHHGVNCYHCAARFLAWWEVKSNDEKIIAKIDGRLKQGEYISNLVMDIFKKSITQLWHEYSDSNPPSVDRDNP